MANLQESDINGALFLAPDGNVVRLVSIIRQPIGIVRDIKTGKQKQVTRQDFDNYRRLVPEKRRYRRNPETQQPQLPSLEAAPVSQEPKNKSEQHSKPKVKAEPPGKPEAKSEAPAKPKVRSEKSAKPKTKPVISAGQPKASPQKPGKEKAPKPAVPTMTFNEAVDKFWLKIVDKKAAIGNVSATGTTIQEAVVAVFNKIGIKCDMEQLREMTDKVPDSSGKKLIKSIIDIPRTARQ